MSPTAVKPDREFTKKISERSGVDVSACYQCLRCSSGCPVADKSDSSPAHILRKVILGRKDELLKSDFIWMCIGCETCKTRCPQDLSARKVVDALKETARLENAPCAEPNVRLFHDTFMNIVRTRGRMNEPLLMAHYKMGSKDYTGDMDLGIKMLQRGKMGINPLSGRIRGAAKVREILGRKGEK